MWKELSEEIQTVVAATAPSLVHVGGPGIPGRTGVVWADDLVVTLARQARDGEAVPVLLASGEVTATVQAWDSRTGLALLRVPGVSHPVPKVAPLPPVGALVLTVAYPSPQGTEARLDLVRFSGGPSEWAPGVSLKALIQTDGLAFPGFGGAVVIDSQGDFVGLVAENRPGNGGFIVPAADLNALVEGLRTHGSTKRAWLGVSTRPAGGQGLVLLSVDEGSPAEQAGWKPGDLLVSLAGQPLREASDLVQVLAGLAAGTTASARILREGEVLEKPVVPGGR